MKKQILSNLTSNYLLNFVGMALGFFLVPFLIGKLGSDIYGIIVLTESTIAFFEILTISLRQALSRHATFAYSQKRMDEFTEYLSTSLRMLYFSTIFILLAGFAISYFFPVLFRVPRGYGLQSQWHFFMISTSFAVSALNIPYWSALYAKQRYDLINFSSSFGLILRALFIYLFYSFAPKEHISLAAYGFIYMAMTLGQNSLIYYWYRANFAGIHLSMRSFKAEKVRNILSFSAHTSISRVSMVLSQNAANILVNIFWGPAMNTVYSLILKLPMLMHRIFSETSYALTPTFTDLAAKNDRKKSEKLLYMYSKLLAIITYPLLWTLILLSHLIIEWWVGPGFSLAGDLMPLYVIILFANIPVSVTGCVLNAHGRVKLPSLLSLGSAILNLTLCFVLGVTFNMGLFGIALAALVSTKSLGLFFLPAYTCRILGISVRKYYMETLLKPFLLSALLLAGGFWTLQILVPEHGKSDLIGLFLAAYAVHYLSAYRWLLNDEEKGHMKDIVRIVKERLGLSQAAPAK